MHEPSTEEVNSVQLPPQVLKEIKGSKGQYHAKASESYEDVAGPLIYIIKSLAFTMNQMSAELEEAKKPKPGAKKPELKSEPKPVAKPTPKKASKK